MRYWIQRIIWLSMNFCIKPIKVFSKAWCILHAVVSVLPDAEWNASYIYKLPCCKSLTTLYHRFTSSNAVLDQIIFLSTSPLMFHNRTAICIFINAYSTIIYFKYQRGGVTIWSHAIYVTLTAAIYFSCHMVLCVTHLTCFEKNPWLFLP